MNHLAHFVLSGKDQDLAIGNFVADFITNRQLPTFTEGVQRGIRLHREIDAFTDSHPVVKQSTKRLHPFHHKYSPVIVDVYYDFLLVKNWDKFGRLDAKNDPSVSLPIFVKNAYDLLNLRIDELPERLKTTLPRMIADDFLMKPTTFAGLEQAFSRIEKAAAFPGNFGNAAEHLAEFLEEFDTQFCAFFPDLQKHVTDFLSTDLRI
ncbi:MAG: ACP phosphodiesterase [Saprospiraceae bacterium]|nr:ACP phosphodiesterase [Saprospiraceae bacterium]